MIPARLLATCSVIAAAAATAAGPARDYPVRPVPFTAVHFRDSFWTPRLETNRTVTVWYDFQRCEETGRLDNFAKAAGLMPGEFRGIPFDDSDVYKVIEGAAYCLALQPDPKLDAYLDALIAKIAAAQEADGYLYTARRLFPPEKMPDMSGPQRWSHMSSSHELYNVGHLYEAAVAHYQATGKRTLLDVALRNADLIVRTFGPGRLVGVPGHEEIEIGLAKLYRVTGTQEYLDLAGFFIDMRGRADLRPIWGANLQDHKPVLQQEEAVGHAVRAGYLYSGVADVAALTGNPDYIRAIDRLWADVVSRKLYLTGGIGAQHGGEAFGSGYELPNASAYNETCAAIANALWNHRMFLLHGEARYLDVLERILYNGFLSGVAMTGDRFFYPNPLASNGRYERSPWFGCACCPVNVVRFIPSIPGFAYATRGDTVYVNLFAGGQARVERPSGAVELSQETRYPWDGHVRLTVTPAQAPAEFELRVRIPGWAQGQPVPSDLYTSLGPAPEPPVLRVNGQPQALDLDQGFAVVRRAWRPGDTLDLDLPLPVRRTVAHAAVRDDAGRVALERGPLVYAVEGVDHDGHVQHLVLPDTAAVTQEARPDLLGGVTVLRAPALAAALGEDGQLTTRPVALTAVPYYAWCHRGAGAMAVWLARTPEVAAPLPRPTIAGTSRPSASHTWQMDTADALNDQAEPRNSIDHDIPRFTWWDHRGTMEWVQYDFAAARRVSSVEVYWFEDTGRGSCRLPQSWRLLHRTGDAWQPVEGASEYGLEPDQYNRTTFAPVETAGLRLEVQLRPDVSGGILEWRVNP